jgi:hypothetical protein
MGRLVFLGFSAWQVLWRWRAVLADVATMCLLWARGVAWPI